MKETKSFENKSTAPKTGESQKTRAPKPKRVVKVSFRIGKNFKNLCDLVYQRTEMKLNTEAHIKSFEATITKEQFSDYNYTLFLSRVKYLAREKGANVKPVVKPTSRILNHPFINHLVNQVSVGTNDITNVTTDLTDVDVRVDEGYSFRELDATEMERISSDLEAFNVATSWAYGYDKGVVDTTGAEALPMFVTFEEEVDNFTNTYYVWSTNRSEPDLCYMAHFFGLNIAGSAYVIPNIPLIGKEEVWAQILLII